MELLPYQIEGCNWLLSRKRALLADEMGLGKTIQALAAIDSLKQPAIVVCPASLKLNWQAEIKKFFPHLLSSIEIYSYELFQKAHPAPEHYNILVVDEAHYLKNPKANRTKAVLDFAKSIPNVWFLTGTPITSTTVDSYTLFSFIAPDNFPKSFLRFAQEYSYPFATNYGWNYSRPKNLVGLHNLAKKHVLLRRTKAEVLTQLPPKIYSQRFVDVTQADKLEIENLSIGVELSELDKSSAHTTTLRRHLAVLKAIPTANIVKEILEEKEKVVVFAYFKQAIDALEKKLKSLLGNDAVVSITGSDSAESRNEAVQAFQNDNRVKVLIGNIVAAGTGITLTASDTVVFLERDWTPANNLQAEDRIHRIGQKNVAQVIDIIVADTIDEAVLSVLQNKQRTIKGAIDGNAQRERAQADECKSVEEALTLPWELGA